MKPCGFRLALASLLTLGLIAPTAAGAGTLDQQQTTPHPEGNAAALHSGQTMAQVFTAGLTGLLDQADVAINSGILSPEPVTVEIRTVTVAGRPTATVLATQLVPAAAFNGASGLQPVVFAAPAAVTAGTQYALVARTEAQSAEGYNWDTGPAGDSYLAGGQFYAENPNPGADDWIGPWTPDTVFRTYVADPPPVINPPAVTPVPTATGQRAAALKKCKKVKTKKARNRCRAKAKRKPA